MTVRVEGLTEFRRALREISPVAYREVHRALIEAGEPVARASRSLALQRIRRMSSSPDWADFRVGVATDYAYVAPKKRGRSGLRKRPNLAGLMVERAMVPAVAANEPVVTAMVGEAIGRALREVGL